MPCQEHPLLVERNIRIDHFTRPKPYDLFFLTHAHSDHMIGLSVAFRKKNNLIYCTKITADLAMLQNPGLTGVNFVIIPLNRAIKIRNRVTVWAIDANHCDGSCMFLFEVCPENRRILFTGDFRFHKSMRSNPILVNQLVDSMHFDDTFLDVEVSDTYPSYQQTFAVLRETIHRIRTTSVGHNIDIYINASILGIEPILRLLGDDLNEQFSVSRGLQHTFRAKQLDYLLPGQLNGTSRLILGHRGKDRIDRDVWIFPTSTHFMCPQGRKTIPKNHTYVWFTTHPNKYEINRLKGIVGVVDETSVACSFSVAPLKCTESII